MYRNVILEFLALYKEQLNKFEYKQLTISLMGRFEISDISSLVLRPDQVLTYHVKEPRIYEKEISFEKFSETIMDMTVYSKEKVHLLKENISSCINDPFYLKDIRNQNFYSISLFPIIKKDEVVGSIIVYFNKDASSFSFKNSDLIHLFDALQSSQGNYFNLLINESIIKNEEFIKIVFLTNSFKCYIDDFLKQKFYLKTNKLLLNDIKLKSKINKEIKNKRYRHIHVNDFDVYYISKYDYNISSNEFDILALETINNSIFNSFSLLFIDNLNIDNDLLNLFSDANIKKYLVKDNLYLYVIDEIISNSITSEIKNKYINNYNLVITSKIITSKMNLAVVAKYVFDYRPNVFNFNDYACFIKNINNIDLAHDLDVNYTTNKHFINSLTKEEFGVLPNIINFDINSEHEEEVYENSIYKLIKNNCNSNYIDFIIPIIPKMLNKKKLTLNIDTLSLSAKNNKKIVKLIITLSNKNVNISDIEKGIKKLKNQGVLVFVDSGIYLNSEALYLLDICDGIFVHKMEFDALVKYPGGINTAIYQYLIKCHKEILVDYNISNVDDAYFNSLFYYYNN